MANTGSLFPGIAQAARNMDSMESMESMDSMEPIESIESMDSATLFMHTGVVTQHE